ncbi:MAG: hypothetical protein EOM46_26560, partial [Gammaproteobacteria bacterium]|nr:hypothetical protein [Gammaproteobacteria bacterium]
MFSTSAGVHRVGEDKPVARSKGLHLYTTVLTLKDDANTRQIVSCRTGFRKVEVKGRLFCINGVPV